MNNVVHDAENPFKAGRWSAVGSTINKRSLGADHAEIPTDVNDLSSSGALVHISHHYARGHRIFHPYREHKIAGPQGEMARKQEVCAIIAK